MATTAQEVSTGAGAAGSIALAMLPAAMAAGPVGMAIEAGVAAISFAAGAIGHLIDGCGAGCTQATAIVNSAETYVEQIVTAYWGTPTRTTAYQQWVLGQLDAVFAKVRQLCGQIPGAPGVNCINERLIRGYAAPWCVSNNLAVGVNDVVPRNDTNILGRCGGWYDVFYDPIAQDPGVVPVSSLDSTVAAIPGLSSVLKSVPGGGYGAVVIIGVALLVLAAMKVRGVI